MAAASRNISVCSTQALSQVGWRLMVASSAKTSRPRAPPTVAGARRRTASRKASISVLAETGGGVGDLLMWTSLHQARGLLTPARTGRMRSAHPRPCGRAEAVLLALEH